MIQDSRGWIAGLPGIHSLPFGHWVGQFGSRAGLASDLARAEAPSSAAADAAQAPERNEEVLAKLRVPRLERERLHEVFLCALGRLQRFVDPAEEVERPRSERPSVERSLGEGERLVRAPEPEMDVARLEQGGLVVALELERAREVGERVLGSVAHEASHSDPEVGLRALQLALAAPQELGQR